MLSLVKELLLSKNVPYSLVEPLVKVHQSVQGNAQQRIQDITEIVAELRDPMKVTTEEVVPEDSGDIIMYHVEEFQAEQDGVSKVQYSFILIIFLKHFLTSPH